MRKLKVAVLGAGYWAVMQIPSWQAVGAEVTALWNRTADKAEALAANFGIGQVYQTPEELFEKADFDVVDIITAPASHFDLVMMAAKYKKNVICQKPMAPTMEQSKMMVDACREAGVWFAIHENFRYRDTWQKIKSVVDSGVLGKIIRADITMGTADPDCLEYEPTLKTMKHSGLYDMGPHIFDVSQHLFGGVKTVYCRERSLLPGFEINETVTAVLEMKSGVLLRCDLRWDKPQGAFISGEKGVLTLDEENYITVKAEDKTEHMERVVLEKPDYILPENWRNHSGEGVNSIRKCNEGLMNAFLKGEKSITNAEDYLKTMELVFKAIVSSEENVVCRTGDI